MKLVFKIGVTLLFGPLPLVLVGFAVPERVGVPILACSLTVSAAGFVLCAVSLIGEVWKL